MFFEKPSADSHASLKFSCDIGEGRKATEKKNVESSPSTLNGAMRDDGWWQYTLQPKMCFLSPALHLLSSLLLPAVFTTGLRIFWGLQDPNTLTSPSWELSAQDASTFEPHRWFSDCEPQESIGKLHNSFHVTWPVEQPWYKPNLTTANYSRWRARRPEGSYGRVDNTMTSTKLLSCCISCV